VEYISVARNSELPNSTSEIAFSVNMYYLGNFTNKKNHKKWNNINLINLNAQMKNEPHYKTIAVWFGEKILQTTLAYFC